MSSWLLGSSIRRSAIALLVATLAWVAPAAAADISGTVFDATGDGFRVYLKVMWADMEGNPMGETNFGTSIDGDELAVSGEEVYLIRGVPPGQYVVAAFMDVAESGVPYASSPIGLSAPISLPNEGLADVDLTVAYPVEIPPPGDAFIDGFVAGDQLTAVFVEIPQDDKGYLTADTVTFCWDTSPVPTGESCESVTVEGDEIDYVLNDLSNGQEYRVVVTTSLDGTDGNQAEVFVTPAAPGAGVTVSGTVTFDTADVPPAGVPVYVALVDDSPQGNAFMARYETDGIASTLPFSIGGVTPGNYFVYVIADLSGDNVFGFGDLGTSENDEQILPVLAADISNVAVTLDEAPAYAFASTDHYKGASSEGYNLSLEIEGSFLRPVRVVLVSGPAGPLGPVDVGLSSWGGFSLWQSDVARPTVGDTYTFAVDYADGSINTVEATVQAVLDSFPTLISPLGPSLNATQPTFDWAAPASPPAPFYTYDFQLWDQNYNRWWEEWDIPSEQTSFAYPEGNPLLIDLNYSWTASVVDRFGNSATAVGEFTPVENLPNTLPSQVGVFRAGKWYLDIDDSHSWTGSDQYFSFGASSDLPAGGDWNNDGTDGMATFRAGKWYLDANDSNSWDFGDVIASFGTAGDLPAAADWTAAEGTELAVYRAGKWYIDVDGSRSWTLGDQVYSFGAASDLPVPADWNGDGTPEMATFRAGKWYVDIDGSHSWNAGDQIYTFGTSGDLPVAGDWNGDGAIDLGVFRSGKFYLDADGSRNWTAGDQIFNFGVAGDKPFAFRMSAPGSPE